MTENPISLIENAEIKTKQALLKARDERVRLIQKAKEEAEAYFIISVKEAELQGREILMEAQSVLEQEKETYKVKLMAEKDALTSKVRSNEDAAIKSIMGIIRGTC